MQKLLQWALILWFIAISVLIIVPAVNLLFRFESQPLPAAFLPPPTVPTIAAIKPGADEKSVAQQLAIATQQAAVFANAVKSYETYTAGYKADLEFRRLTIQQRNFTLVVKETLVTLLTSVAAAFVGFAFVSGAAGVIDNINRMRSNMPPQRLRMFQEDTGTAAPQENPG